MGICFLSCRSGSYHRDPIRMHESTEPCGGFTFGIGGHFRPLEHAMSFFYVCRSPQKTMNFASDYSCNTSDAHAALQSS